MSILDLQMGERETWRLIKHPPAPGPWNMAVDQALLQTVIGGGRPVLRLYSWRPYALSIGYAQNMALIDAAACRRAGVDVVRRPTGGRAVLHAAEVTYSIALPPGHRLVASGVIKSYKLLSVGFIRAFARLGLQVEPVAPELPEDDREVPGASGEPEAREMEAAEGERPALSRYLNSGAACFDAPSWYELTVAGRKVIGSAQVRKKGAVLQHGSIPLYLDAEALFSLLKFPDEGRRRRAAAAFSQKAAGLNQLGLGEFPAERVEEALIQGFAEAFHLQFASSDLSREEAAWVERFLATAGPTASPAQSPSPAPAEN
ncbi:MAG TPA: lipoate--protein ligase family protein [Firmicutes bacterium]|nr:lipoate--protein ligase family protein [Bacillota bacterium]